MWKELVVTVAMTFVVASAARVCSCDGRRGRTWTQCMTEQYKRVDANATFCETKCLKQFGATPLLKCHTRQTFEDLGVMADWRQCIAKQYGSHVGCSNDGTKGKTIEEQLEEFYDSYEDTTDYYPTETEYSYEDDDSGSYEDDTGSYEDSEYMSEYPSEDSEYTNSETDYPSPSPELDALNLRMDKLYDSINRVYADSDLEKFDECVDKCYATVEYEEYGDGSDEGVTYYDYITEDDDEVKACEKEFACERAHIDLTKYETAGEACASAALDAAYDDYDNEVSTVDMHCECADEISPSAGKKCADLVAELIEVEKKLEAEWETWEAAMYGDEETTAPDDDDDGTVPTFDRRRRRRSKRSTVRARRMSMARVHRRRRRNTRR